MNIVLRDGLAWRVLADGSQVTLSPGEGADEIERLRATAAWDVKILNAEIDRLRARNAKLEDALRMVVSSGHDESSRAFAAEVAARAIKPDYAPARDPSDHLACGGSVG